MLAVAGADLIEALGVATPLVMLGVILMTFVLNLFITSGSAQWTLMAPVIVPAMMVLGVNPETSQVLFRIGDSGSHLITPLNVYFALMLTYLQRYRRDAGIGTLVSMTLPIAIAVLVGWSLFFLAWYALGIPLGPGARGRPMVSGETAEGVAPASDRTGVPHCSPSASEHLSKRGAPSNPIFIYRWDRRRRNAVWQR